MLIINGLLSAIFAALTAIVAKIGLKSIDPMVATGVRSVVMSIFLCMVLVFFKKDVRTVLSDQHAIIFIIISGILGAISMFFYFNGLQIGEASKLAALDRTSVVFVYILAVLFLSEQITWQSILGSVMIAGGAILMIK
ncbi:MAG: EamA family transporter [bacterium]